MYKVMLIDDEKWIIRSLRTSLDWKAYGFEIVAEAANGVEGLERIRQYAPDLVFTDIRMPGLDGLEMMRQVNELDTGTCFVVTSGYKDFDYAQQAIRYGALDYCLKPFEEAELLAVLDKFGNAMQKRPVLRSDPAEPPVAERRPAYDESVRSATFHQVIDYINEHFREDLSLQSLSDQLGLNLSYVSQLFRKNGNETFLQYLTAKRISCACELLANSSLSIQEVSGRVGFADYFHFAKTFKKITGRTATEYREFQRARRG